jgi:hypothetical protein
MVGTSDIDSFRDKCSSMLAPHFEILFKITQALSTRFGFIIPWEFWIALSFTIYATYMHFFGYSDTELLFFGSFAIISLLFANSSLIFNFIKKVREATPQTTLFLNEIENKEIQEVQKFLREHGNLSSKEIIIILKSKFNSYPAIHLSILKYQTISGEILEYIIANSIDKNLDPDVVSKYIFNIRDDVSNSTVNQILFRYGDKQIRKSLFISFPLHFHKIPILSFFVKFRNNIRDWFRYGTGDGVVAIPALILAIITAVNYYVPILQKALINFDIVAIILGLINAIMGLFIITGILFIIFKVMILIILRVIKWILYLITPSSVVPTLYL